MITNHDSNVVESNITTALEALMVACDFDT